MYSLRKSFNFRVFKLIGSRAHVLINFHNKTLAFINDVYPDGDIILGVGWEREHLVTMATEMLFQKKYELYFLEEIMYFP